MNEDGDSLSHELYLSGPEQIFSGTYTIPLANPLTDSYELTYGLRHEDHEDTQSLEASAEIARRWLFENGWTQRLFFRTTYEDFTQADQEDQVLLMYPGISWARVRTRNPRFPSWGDRQRLSLAVSNDVWGSDASFVRATLDSQWIRMLGEDTRFVGRTGIGTMHTDDFEKSLRHYASLQAAIRVFVAIAMKAWLQKRTRRASWRTTLVDCQSGSAATHYRRLVGAAFADTGNAFSSWWPDELATGAGLGVRWVSPVGPVRLDIAHPFDSEEDSWRLHFAIGPEF
ncbi:autotransporter assembly complex protein TamA [Modicisalibacter luteus]